jgi:hypothetical protein
MSVAIRNGSVCVLALGLVVGLANVRAASDDSIPTALDSVQPNGLASMPSGDEIPLTEANILIDRLAYPLTSCCVAQPGERVFACFAPMPAAQCVERAGIPVKSCGACVSLRPSVKSEGEVDTTEDDPQVSE